MRDLYDGRVHFARFAVHLHRDGFLGDYSGCGALSEACAVTTSLEQGLGQRASGVLEEHLNRGAQMC